MVNKIAAALVLLVLLPLGGGLAGAEVAEDARVRLKVDFTNTEARSVSVPAGLNDGITEEMDFGLLSGAGELFAEIYPFEISSKRFWSAPLPVEAFSKVTIGTVVIRVSLLPSESERLRTESKARAAVLKRAVLRERLKNLKLSLIDIDHGIAVLEFKRGKLHRKLSVELREARKNLGARLKRINIDLDESRDELGKLEDERDNLIEEKKDLNKRSNPPQTRIERLNREIIDLNENIEELRRESRDLRERRRELTAEAKKRGIFQLRERLSEMNINADRDYVEIEDLRQEKARIEAELKKLEIELYQ